MDKQQLTKLAKLVRYYILKMTTKAGSGHPTSSLSAADLMAALFFNHLRFDLENLDNPANDRVIFSKGHASPLLYALYGAAGVLSEEELLTYRQFGSVLEGHPNPRFKYVEVATGSFGQGLSIGLGMALALRARISNIQSPISNSEKARLPKVYVLMGDGEMAEGSVWEACELASYYEVGNLVGIIDVNRLGQSRPTMLAWDTDTYKKRVSAFGWEAETIDGHDFDQILKAYEWAQKGGSRPKMIIAKTIKGRGISFLENKEGWHGKALSEEQFEEAVRELGEVDRMVRGEIAKPSSRLGTGLLLARGSARNNPAKRKSSSQKLKVNYKIGEEIATRKAYGETLAKLGEIDPKIVALDGEVSNSTFSEIFREKFPKRYFEMFIAEQNMAGVALGMAKRGFTPFVSTFAAFFTRAHDQIRMSAYSLGNIKFVGSHAGVSIGEDGPSQMGLEDFALFRSIFGSVVLCPGDAVSCAGLVEAAAFHEGLVYIRTARMATPVIYSGSEQFKIGGSAVVKSSKSDKLTIVACGVTLAEAMKAADELSREGVNVRLIDAYSIKPIDEAGIKKAASETNNLAVTVEDHFAEGGLGDAVLSALANQDQVKVHKLAVFKMPMSGRHGELLDYEGISAKSIVKKVRELVG